MYRYLIALFSLLFSFNVFAFDENSMPSLSTPTQLDPNSMEASIVHRFLREPAGIFPDNFISHANVSVALKYIPLQKLEVGTSYQFYFKEYTFHAAYSLFLPQRILRTQALIQFFSAQHDLDQNWDQNFFYQINIQSEPIAGRCLPIVNIGFNGLTKKPGIGTGIDVIILNNLDFLAEYYPVLGARDTSYNGSAKVNYFSTGIKLTTAGHQFMFSISNDYDIGVRRHMAGATDNTLFYGFNIQRLFAL
jgi:hypothetical protein